MNIRNLIILSIVVLTIIIISLFGYRDIPIGQLKKKYTNLSSSFMPIDGMRVHFRDEGKKNSIPIVLLHGTGSSLHTYDDWTKKLIVNHRVIRIDLPGYGLTGAFPNRNYSIKNYVTFLKKFLNSVGVKECVIGGSSLGGNIAWNFTVKNSEMVNGLILIDAGGYPIKSKSIPIAFQLAKVPIIQNIFKFITPKFVVESSVKNVYKDKKKVSDDLVNRYFELTLREGNREAFIDRFKVKFDSISPKKIRTINQRTLILWGENDELIPLNIAYQFQDDLPNDTLVILKNVGHIPMEESPDESLKPVLKFLENY